MKKYVLLCIPFIFGLQLSSQTPIKEQPGQSYFDIIEKIIIEKTIPEKDLLTAPAGVIPENFIDTLKKYDWIYLGGYSYSEKKYTDYKNFYKEYKILRFNENGGQLDFSINGYQNYVITHTNTSNIPWKHTSIVSLNNSFYFLNETPNEKSYQKLVSYTNGTLIYLITKSGKSNDNAVYYRECYTSVPKMFNWNFGE